jgi:hypothetical protein
MSFQKTLPDIETPVVTEGPRPTTHQAELLSTVAGVASQAIGGVQNYRLKSDVQESADVATAISGAVAEKGKDVFNKEGALNTEGLSPDLQKQIARVQANAGDKFKRIASAVRQGAASADAAALETEATVRQLISQTPGFGREIKDLARELVGFDPTGFALRKILDISSTKSTRVTAQMKRVEEAQVMQDGLARVGKSVSMDTLLGNLALRDSLTLERETLDSQLDLNTLSLDQWAQKSFVERGVDLNQTMLKVVAMGADGGITDNRQYVNAVIAQREEDKSTFRAEIAAKGGMRPEAAAAVESRIDAMYAPIVKSINDNKLGDVLADKINLIAKLNQMWGKQATPRLTRIIDAYGPQIGGQLLEMMSNIADPAQFELVYQFDPGLKAIVQGGQATQQDVADGVESVVNKVINGDQITEDDIQFRNMAETMVTQPGNSELREEFVKGLGRSGSPVRAVSILSTKVPRVQATVGEVKFMKEQFDVHVGTAATENVPGNLVDSIAREIMSLNTAGMRGELQVMPVSSISTRAQLMGLSSKPTGQTKMVIPYDPTFQGAALDFQTDSMKRLQPFMDAVTTKGYAGDLGANKDTFATDLVARVNARIAKLRVDEAPAKADPKQKKESLFTSIYNPSMVTGWALPENRPVPLEEITFDSHIEAIQITESDGDQKAVSPSGAIGSMQVMPATAADPGFGIKPAIKNPDGSYNLDDIDRLGKEYIAAMMVRYEDDFEAALVAYNAGPGNADKWLKAGKDYSVLPDRIQTEDYVVKVYDELSTITKKKGDKE